MLHANSQKHWKLQSHAGQVGAFTRKDLFKCPNPPLSAEKRLGLSLISGCLHKQHELGNMESSSDAPARMGHGCQGKCPAQLKPLSILPSFIRVCGAVRHNSPYILASDETTNTVRPRMISSIYPESRFFVESEGSPHFLPGFERGVLPLNPLFLGDKTDTTAPGGSDQRAEAHGLPPGDSTGCGKRSPGKGQRQNKPSTF